MPKIESQWLKIVDLLAMLMHIARKNALIALRKNFAMILLKARITMDEYELKPCPFCGDKGVVQRSGHCFRVCCSNRDCPIEPRTHWFFNHLSAIKDWNRRAENG